MDNFKSRIIQSLLNDFGAWRKFQAFGLDKAKPLVKQHYMLFSRQKKKHWLRLKNSVAILLSAWILHRYLSEGLSYLITNMVFKTWLRSIGRLQQRWTETNCWLGTEMKIGPTELEPPGPCFVSNCSANCSIQSFQKSCAKHFPKIVVPNIIHIFPPIFFLEKRRIQQTNHCSCAMGDIFLPPSLEDSVSAPASGYNQAVVPPSYWKEMKGAFCWLVVPN